MSLDGKFESLVPFAGVDELFRAAKLIDEIDESVTSSVIADALLWMASQLKSPDEYDNPFHFGRIVAMSRYYLRFEGRVSGNTNITPVVCRKKPALNEGWVRTVWLGSEIINPASLPENPAGSWSTGMYLKLLDSPVSNQDDVKSAGGVFIPVPNSQLFDPNQSTN